MRRFHETLDSVESYSPSEERFNRRRRTAGLFVAPLVFAALLIAPLPLAPPAHRMAAVMGLVVILWVSEALPVAVTAIFGPLVAIVLGVAPARTALAPFADPIIFLFIGSFILAEAMFVHGVDRRIAFTALSWRFVGSSATRMLVVYGGVATALSMWILPPDRPPPPRLRRSAEASVKVEGGGYPCGDLLRGRFCVLARVVEGKFLLPAAATGTCLRDFFNAAARASDLVRRVDNQ
jgi:di/tricarboxylate transporter